jgi:hypothetical protein
MNDPASLAALSGSGLIAIGLASAALLRAWYGWLELRRLDVAGRGGRGQRAGSELAELRARVRRLETIANGGEV